MPNLERQMLDASGDAVLLHADGVVLDCNQACVRMYGYPTPASVIGMPMAQFTPAHRLAWVAQQALNPDPSDFESEGLRADGSTFPVLVRRVQVTGGQPGMRISVIRDLSDERAARAALEEREARLRVATEAAGVGVWEWRLDTNEMIYSPQARAIAGLPAEGPITYEMVVGVTHPDDYPWTSAQAARAIDPLIRDSSPYEYRLVRPSGEVRWVVAQGEAIFELIDDDLVASRYTGALIDITGRRRAEEAARDSERRLTLALEAGRMAVWQVDADGVLAPSAEINALIGLPPDARPTLGDLEPSYLPGELDRIRQVAEAARRRGEAYFDVEYQYRRADGEVRWFNARSEVLTASDGSPAGAIGIVLDVTDRKADEERLQLLAREVDHRANNLLTVVQGAVRMSRAGSVDELRDVIGGRVHALARAHQLLADGRWSGANLQRLVEEELAPFNLGDECRAAIGGPSVELTPAAAQGVAMALHELATNAAKHGALSTPAGRVDVSWTVLGGSLLRLLWMETGGPPVVAPIRRGFGSSVLSRALGGGLGGQTQLNWAPEGLRCVLELPLPAPLRA